MNFQLANFDLSCFVCLLLKQLSATYSFFITVCYEYVDFLCTILINFFSIILKCLLLLHTNNNKNTCTESITLHELLEWFTYGPNKCRTVVTVVMG